MTHEPAAYVATEERTETGRTIYRCLVCGRGMPGRSPPLKPCVGRCAATKGGTPKPEPKPADLACVHRRQKIDSVPCGTCAATGRAKTIPVYLCVVGNGRACSLVDVGRADVVTCGAACAERIAPPLPPQAPPS